MARRMGAILREVYDRLYGGFGPQHWWPARTPLEVAVGAILTQNTAWANVERAIERLRAEGLLEFAALRCTPEARLKELIRPAGYYNQKARYLAALVAYLDRECDGHLSHLFARGAGRVREGLLSLPGIGPETADSILLYAGGCAVFVVDAYTFRVFSRLKLGPTGASYEAMQAFLMRHLPRDAALYNEYHALIVRLGKEVCRTSPGCAQCPLRELPCPTGLEAGREERSPGHRGPPRKARRVPKRVDKG